MHRCLELAKPGAGYVAPNPMVGAVLVHENRIIGEGYHQVYGKEHAEVHCIRSVKEEDRPLLSKSTLYVSLEPCSHHGKTPPCADLIIEKKIPAVVIGCRDPFKQVDGRGIEKLKAAGIQVTAGVLEKEAVSLNKRFITFHTHHRPYIILKWAQTANGKIAQGTASRLQISNDYTNRLVHKWRSEEASVLVGTTTAQADDPQLTNRHWQGHHPVRMVIDKELRLPPSLRLFDKQVRTIVFNFIKHDEQPHLLYYRVTGDVSLVHQVVHALYRLNIQSMLVEGGAGLLQSFIDENMWDEARIITNRELRVPAGLAAPVLTNGILQQQEQLFSDSIDFIINPKIVVH